MPAVNLVTPPPAPAASSEPAPAPTGLARPSPVNRTIVGMAAPLAQAPAASPAHVEATANPAPAGAPIMGSAPAGAQVAASPTLLGVARPGIAPLEPGVAKDFGPPGGAESAKAGYDASHELGATIGPAAGSPFIAAPGWDTPDLGPARVAGVRPAQPPRPARAAPPSKRALALIAAGGVLALSAVLFALFWPSAPPLEARARADAEGREAVEIRCASCPDGTTVTLSGVQATVTNKTALVTLPSPLALGETRMKATVDRPGDGRDETVALTVNVAYRIRPDLALLQSDKPSIQIVAEASRGTGVSVDGKPLEIAGGRAIEVIDVTDSCTGLSDEPKTLSRQIPYLVTPEDGPEERGVVSVSVGIVPLHLDAPGLRVTTEGPSFVLAGRTMKGAELTAAGRAITVKPDGSFAQVMNVSSIGATEIEVWAKMVGLAPRRVKIKVRRVASLDTAAREFLAEAPIGYDALARDIAGNVGKPVMLAGEVIEARRQNHATVMLLDVATSSGCPSAGTCTARLWQGADNPAKKGDKIRVFGQVARAFPVAGKADIPEIDVEFAIKGSR